MTSIVFDSPPEVVVVTTTEQVVVVESPQPEVITAEFGLQGPPGPPGPPGASQNGVASAALSGHRVLSWDAAGALQYAQPGQATAGVGLNAAALGGIVTLAGPGALVAHAGWAWTPGEPVYLTSDGVMTQAEPAGVVHIVAQAVSATSLCVGTDLIFEG